MSQSFNFTLPSDGDVQIIIGDSDTNAELVVEDGKQVLKFDRVVNGQTVHYAIPNESKIIS